MLAVALRQRRRAQAHAATRANAGCRIFRPPRSAATLEVPEDRAKPDGRKIRIFAAVLPANTVTPKDDPLVILAGGPGQAASQRSRPSPRDSPSFAARATSC